MTCIVCKKVLTFSSSTYSFSVKIVYTYESRIKVKKQEYVKIICYK